MTSLHRTAKLITSIWSYHHKRLPNGKLLKYKSRICVNGKEQSFGRDYWETYVPVASWVTIHMMLTLSSILKLKSCKVDYTQAFPQVFLDDTVYIWIPQGWFVHESQLCQYENPKCNDPHNYMKLKLYGCKQAAHSWFKHLMRGLLKRSFTQSKTDQCLFLQNNSILVVYVDDCLLFAKDA
jgi:hypothetical protein